VHHMSSARVFISKGFVTIQTFSAIIIPKLIIGMVCFHVSQVIPFMRVLAVASVTVKINSHCVKF